MKSYKVYQLQKGEWKQHFEMHLSILRFIFILQIALIVIIPVFNLDSHNFTQPNSLQQKPRISIRNFDPFAMINQPAFRTFKITFWASFLLYPLLWPIFIILARRRASLFRNKTIRGASLLSEKQFKKLLKGEDKSLHLTESVAIPSEYENRHFLILGASGTGKSNFISYIISQEKDKGAKGIIYDRKDGEYLSRFFDPKRDYIYNPFDMRSLHWNVLDGKQTDSDFDSLAAAVVPSASGKEKFFNDAARDVLASIFRYCYLKDTKTNTDIWDVLCRPVPELHKMLTRINSDAAGYILNHQSGQTQGVISTLMQYARIFKYLRFGEDVPTFSLKDWVADEKRSGFIFLTNTTKQRESLRGILSLFINCLADEVLSLKDNLSRRIFFFLDEFGTLQKMDAVKDLIILTRSKGCSFWLGIQDKSLLDNIYEKDVADTIVNNCNNYLIFRLNGYDNARYMSDLLGEAEKDFSLVMGNKGSTAGESYRNQAKIEKLVLPSEIQSLLDLHFYLKLHGLPATQASHNYMEFPPIEPGFIPNRQLLKVRQPASTRPKDILSSDLEIKPSEVDKDSGKQFSVDDFNF